MDRFSRRRQNHRVWAGGRAGIVAAVAIAGAAVFSGGATTTQAGVRAVEVGQQNGGTLPAAQFNAAVLTIGQGDTLHWTWFADPIGHTVISFSQTGGVPDWQTPGLLNGAGQSFDHTFTTLGTFTYYCSVHALRASADPANVDASIASGLMVGKVTVSASVGGIALSPDERTLAAAGRAQGNHARKRPVVLMLATMLLVAVAGTSVWHVWLRRAR